MWPNLAKLFSWWLPLWQHHWNKMEDAKHVRAEEDRKSSGSLLQNIITMDHSIVNVFFFLGQCHASLVSSPWETNSIEPQNLSSVIAESRLAESKKHVRALHEDHKSSRCSKSLQREIFADDWLSQVPLSSPENKSRILIARSLFSLLWHLKQKWGEARSMWGLHEYHKSSRSLF